MLDMLIFFVFISFVILIGIKYGLLEIFAIILAILALVPFAISAYLYFEKKPVIKYQLAGKNKFKEGNKYIYETFLGIHCEKGKTLLNDLFIAPEFGVIPVKHPSYTGNFQYDGITEEGGFTATARVSIGEKPFFPKTGFGYFIRFESEEDKNKFLVRFIVDTKMDPFKQGFLSIFQPNYHYRYFAEIPIDFENSNLQTGYFKNKYR